MGANALLKDRVDALLAEHNPSTVLLYASLPDEVPTLHTIASLPCRCVLPCVVDDVHLQLRQYTGPSDLVVSGRFHIPEPTGPLFTDYASIDLAFIPGMAFDRQGHRLGRGKGYYDRLLAHPAFAHIPKVGVCYDFQLLPSIPVEAHDCLMDQLIVIPTT